MYCAKCGQSMPDDAIFCGECGAKVEIEQIQELLIQEQPVQETIPVVQNKPKNKLIKPVIIAILILALMVSAFITVGKKLYSPEAVAKKYFLDMMKADWNAVYEELDIQDEKFLSKQEFINAKQDTKKKILNTFQLKNITNKKETISQTLLISYRLKGDLDNQVESVILNKQGKKEFFLFDRWKVSPEEHIARDCPISVPMNAEVFLGDKKIPKEYLLKNNDEWNEYDTYKIPAMFKGSFNVKIQQKNMETISTSFRSEEGYMLNPDEMVLSSDIKEKLIKMADEAMKEIYANAAKQAPYSEVEDLFIKDNHNFDPEDMYTRVKEKFDNTQYRWIEKIDFSKVEGTVSYRVRDGEMYFIVDINADYDLSYYKNGWFSTEASLYEKSDNSSMQLTYSYVNDSWTINDAEDFYIYY